MDNEKSSDPVPTQHSQGHQHESEISRDGTARVVHHKTHRELRDEIAQKEHHLHLIEVVLDETAWVESDPILHTDPDRERLKANRSFLRRALEGLRTAHQYSQWQKVSGDFATYFDAQFYLHPTFKFPVSESYFWRTIHEYITGFGPNAWAIVGAERTPGLGLLHAHLLLGGIETEVAKSHVGRLWKHGNIEVFPYDASKGGAWYATKFPEEVQMIGRPQRRTRRPRRRRQKDKT